MAGFTFNGVHSSTFGVVRTVDRQLIPETKTRLKTRVNADGSLDYTSVNDKGRPLYEDRLIRVKLQCKSVDNRISIAKWLMPEGELIFDDEPQKIWKAKSYGSLSFTPEIVNHYAEYELIFRCDPFAYGVEETYTENGGGTITLGGGGFYSDSLVFSFSGSGTVTVTKPLVSGDLFGISKRQSFSMDCDGNETVDCHLKITGNTSLTGFSGEFIEIEDIGNTITISGNSSIRTTVKYRKRYL